MSEWKYEVCGICKREQRIAWAINNEIWFKVMGENKLVVCLECFLKKAEERKIKVKVDDLTFFSFIDKVSKNE